MIPDVPSLNTHEAAHSPNVVPLPPSPPSPSASTIDISPSRPVLVDDSSPPRTGGYIPPRAHILVRVAQYETYLASRSALVHVPHPIPPVPTPSPRPLSGTPLRPSPPPLPSYWNPQSPLHPPARASSSPATPGNPVGAVWANPSAARTHLPRHAPRDYFPSDTPTPPLSSRPLPYDLPIPSALVPGPSPSSSCPSPTTSLGSLSPHHHAESPTILPHPCNHHDKHSTPGPGRSRAPTTPLGPKERAASTSSHIAHGTVPGSWSGSRPEIVTWLSRESCISLYFSFLLSSWS